MITAEEYRQGKTKEAQELFKKYEKEIDSSIVRNGYAQVHLDASRNKVPAAVVNLIKMSYEAAGWKVKRESGSDCRGDDWDYLMISEK